MSARTVTPTPAPDLPASALERQFAYYWRAVANDTPPYAPEYRFGAYIAGGPGRGLRARLEKAGVKDWRFDFAFVGAKVAVELEGGTFSGGRHTRGKGFADDCEKYNRAVLDGWRVLRYTSDMLKRDPNGVIAQIVEAVNA